MKRDTDRTGLHHIPSHEEGAGWGDAVAIIVLFIFFALAIFALTGCADDPKSSSKQVESVSDAGAMAIYRHSAKMDDLAAELQMIHPVTLPKGAQ